MMSVMIIWG